MLLADQPLGNEAHGDLRRHRLAHHGRGDAAGDAEDVLARAAVHRGEVAEGHLVLLDGLEIHREYAARQQEAQAVVLEAVIHLAGAVQAGEALHVIVHEHAVALVEAEDRTQDLPRIDRGIVVTLVDAGELRSAARTQHLADEQLHGGGLHQAAEQVEMPAIHHRAEIVRRAEQYLLVEPEEAGDGPQVGPGRRVGASQVLVELLAIDADPPAQVGDRAGPLAEDAEVLGEEFLLVH